MITTKLLTKLEFKPIETQKEYLDYIDYCSKVMNNGIQMNNKEIEDVMEKFAAILNYRRRNYT